MNEITHKDVQIFLTESSLNLSPGQNKISFPIIQRIHRRLQMGNKFDPINVSADGIICDGHHRYICLSILGFDIETTPGGKNLTASEEFQWQNMNLETDDYDTTDEINRYKIKYG